MKKAEYWKFVNCVFYLYYEADTYLRQAFSSTWVVKYYVKWRPFVKFVTQHKLTLEITVCVNVQLYQIDSSAILDK